MKSRLPLDPDKLKRQTQRLGDKLPFSAQVLLVCDGDTILVARDCLEGESKRQEYIRLAAIDAPEMRGPDARMALWSQQFLEKWILGQVVTVTPRRIWRDPYHRIIATVTFGGKDVGTCLLENGHAVVRKTSR
jgi:endonuclease YncB( thermonuclease family)